MEEYGRMDSFSFVGSKDVPYPVRVRMYGVHPSSSCGRTDLL